jgi:hypothetical protein
MPNYNLQQQQPFFQYQQYPQSTTTEANIINAAHAAGRSLPPLSHLLPNKTDIKDNGTSDNIAGFAPQENNGQPPSNDLEVQVNHASSSVVNPYYQNMDDKMQQTYSNTNGVINMDQTSPYVVKEMRGNNEKHHQQEEEQQYNAQVLISPENIYAINNRNRFSTPSMVSSDGSDHHHQHISKNTSQSPVVSTDISLNMTHPYTSPSASYYDNMTSQTNNKLVQVKYDYSPYGPTNPMMTNTSLTNNGNMTWKDYNVQNPGPSNQNQAYEDFQKVYSFVPLAGSTQKKRPRRKFNEVERLYQCNYPNCTKAYGTLNHLNAHITMQEHVRYFSFSFFLTIL